MSEFKEFKKDLNVFITDEKVRREKALAWLDKFVKILSPVAPDIWGKGIYIDSQPTYTIDIDGEFYFRFKEDNEEPVGFYCDDLDIIIPNFYGIPIKDLEGPVFWDAMEKIHHWYTTLQRRLDVKSGVREEIYRKLQKLSLD